jgi:GT2 family glycosyltransferase
MKLQSLILQDVAKENILYNLYVTEEEIMRRMVSTETLYGRMKDASFAERSARGVYFRDNGVLTLDTYLNSFSTGKWKKYTIIQNLQLILEIQGDFTITLLHAKLAAGQIVEEELLKEHFYAKEREEIQMDFGELRSEGIFYAKLETLSHGSMLYSGYYGTADLAPTQAVKLAIDVCTFKREQYVKRNMEILKKDILENPSSPCYEKLWIHISDNASTLDGIVDSQPHITVDKNANLGGVGGFTRGIIETKKLEKEYGFTHVLLMDDDATISSAAVEENFLLLSYLKEEYFAYTVGGKLLVLDAPFIQFEVGARWNAGNILALKHFKDVRNRYEVLDSEYEDIKAEYEGWWYCCIPLSEIGEDNLPLPIFIHRDDVEYGLRVGRERFIFLNQICIWHEAFAGKMPGVLDYYDIRNHCITNAIHCPEFTKEDFKKFFTKWVWGNISKYRYKYVDYNVKAVEDFCKGIDWLLAQDGFVLHQELFAMNYKAKPVAEYVGLHDFTQEDAALREWGEYKLPKAVRMFRLATANGYFFPAKSNKIIVSAPYGSVYRLYRRNRTLVVDNYGNGVYLERDRKQFWECKRKLKNALKLIDEKYEEAVKSYHQRYKELTSLKFWEYYLGIDK